MERHYSLGTADLVALMAAHRATMARADRFDQSLVNRLRAVLGVAVDSPPRNPADSDSTGTMFFLEQRRRP